MLEASIVSNNSKSINSYCVVKRNGKPLLGKMNGEKEEVDQQQGDGFSCCVDECSVGRPERPN